jgi:hypothetical protein
MTENKLFTKLFFINIYKNPKIRNNWKLRQSEKLLYTQVMTHCMPLKCYLRRTPGTVAQVAE